MTTTIARPPITIGINGAAQSMLGEIEEWLPRFERGELHPVTAEHPVAPDERFAVQVGGVRAAGLGNPAAGGVLHATDRRAVVLGHEHEPVREWTLSELGSVTALGNWWGVRLVHVGGDTELVVAGDPQPPTWQDAAGWLKVEAAFASASGHLSQWLAELPLRLALAAPA